MMKLFGSEYEEIGSLDKNLVLNTAGKVKIRYGNKFTDLNIELIEKLIQRIEKLENRIEKLEDLIKDI